MAPLSGATNVDIEIHEAVLTVVVDLTATGGAASKSGKSVSVANSGGARPLGATGASLSLTVNAKADKVELPTDPKSFHAPDGLKNVGMVLDGTCLKFSIDLSKDFGPSSTGHTTIIASSSGIKPIPGTNAFFNLNVFCKGKVKLSADAAEAAEEGEAAEPSKGLQGVKVTVSGTQCSFVVDLSKSLGPSKAGKATMLATSGGIATVPGAEASFNLVVCQSLKAKEGPAADVAETELPGGKKLRYSIKGNQLTLSFNLAEDAGKSKTGKSTIVAGTSGMRRLPASDLSVSLTVFTTGGAAGKGDAARPAKRAKPTPKEDASD